MALSDIVEPFVWGAGGSRLTPEQIARQREIAGALMQQGLDFSPIASPWQGAARVANAAAGAFKDWRADKAASANATTNESLIANLLSGSGPQQFPAAPGSSEIAPSASTASSETPAASNPVAYSPLAEGTDWLTYANQGATRNQPLSDKLTNALGSFLPEMGVTMKVFSGGQDAEGPRRTGSHRHDHGNAADVFFYKDGRQLSWDNPQDLPIFEDIVRRGKAAGVTGFGAGDGYMRPGSMHIGFGTPAVWGAGGRGTNAPDWLRQAYNSPAGQPPAVAAVNALAQGQPTQVASLDQSVGLPQQAPIPQAAPPLPAPRTIQDMPVAGTPAGQQVAQALAGPDLSRIPVTAGGNAGVYQPGQGNMQAIVQALSSPYADEQTKRIAGMLLGQQMERQQQASDPLRQLQIQKIQQEMQRGQPLINAGGGAIYNPNTGEWLTSPNGGQTELPSRVREYEYAKSQGFPGSFNDWLASQKGGMSLQVDPATGAVTFQQGGNIKPMTEAQSKDATFAVRAEGALPLIDKFGNALTSLPESAAGSLPGGVGNYMQSPEYQQAQQAGTEFLQAILRKDTGAAITPAETAEYGKVYLPRPGDSPEVLEQKKVSRTRALEALKAGMTPQAILAQEKALKNTEDKAGKKITTPDGYTIEEVP